MTAAVLGTPLETARDDDLPRTVLLSDLHIDIDGGSPLDQLRAVLSAARARADETRVLILGDLFEYWTGPRQLRVEAHGEVAEVLRETTAAGTPVTVLHGNRDFMMDRAFERRTGVRVVAGGLFFRLGERRCLALHGDELCLNDLPYQRSKKVLRHGVTRAILRNLPLRTAMWLGEKVRQKSVQSTTGAEQVRFDPVADAMHAVFELDVELLVFGHIHRPARGRFEDRGEYVILPAFDETGVHLVFEDGQLTYRSAAGNPMPDYPAREFPALRGE